MAGVFASIVGTIDSVTDTTITTMLTYSDGLKAIVGSCWGIYVVYQVYRAIAGDHHFSMYREIVIDALRVSLICAFAFNADAYATHIIPIIRGLGSDLSVLITHSDGSINDKLDNIIEIGIALITQQSDKISLISPGLSLMAIIYILIVGVGLLTFLTAGCILIITTSIASAVLSILGMLFLMFAIFPATRNWFWAWISQIASVTLLRVLFSIVTTLAIAMLKGVLETANGDQEMLKSAVGLFLIVSSFAVVIVELPGFAASLVGSSGLSRAGSGGIDTNSVMKSAAKNGMGVGGKLGKYINSSIKGKFGNSIG